MSFSARTCAASGSSWRSWPTVSAFAGTSATICTDPDATHTGLTRTTSRLGYNAHYVVDGGKARIILSALVVVQVVLLAATIGAFAFMLSCLWATMRVTFVGVPESVPEETQAEESAEEVRSSH